MPPLSKTDVNFWKYDIENRRSFSDLPEQPLKKYSRRSRKLVHFDEQLQVKYVLHLNDYTSEEIKDTWYSGADNSRFRKDIATTVRLIINKSEDIDGLQYTSRGAECRMKQVLKRRYKLKFQTWSVVLDEQEFQREVGERSDYRIAAAYIHVSRDAVREAFQLAIMDQFDAYRYQNEQCQTDEFSDDWIRSISTQQDFTNANQPTKQPNFREDAGFDDTWIRDFSDPRVGP
jgi:hypothetical protein